ncbi:transposon Ty3-I Gag-Pol polyprotein [Trichonephila inaurata madagascariensis]|uniref:Transposon Ty3-I Gag-Pol polyprotein n=1 Tax=Trichonephila inaurata madagascariensis TaxID=2747483 RepID=A0A8X6XRA6_9ARAC|nr:transposon Ty3-I Gag-Pol polyprotein [Trichonephila inaurata madagascariensis]
MLLYENLTEQCVEENSVVTYVFELINRMKQCQELAIENMQKSKESQKLWYDLKAEKREFRKGDLVLLVASSKPNKLSVNWIGLGKVVKQLSETNYVIHFPDSDKTQVYHANMMKPYFQREENINLLSLESSLIKEEDGEIPKLELGIKNTELSDIWMNIQLNIRLTADQKEKLSQLIKRNPESGSRKMLRLNVIEKGESDFSSPLILVEAPGKEARPCIDYRRLNKVTRTKFFPLPNIEELIEKVSAAKYVSFLDLTRVYWQIPLSKNAQRYAAFVTNFGQGLRTPGELKVQVIKDFPIPTNKTQVRAFLGLAGYYRRYIPEFSVITAPLTDLLKGRNRNQPLTGIVLARMHLRSSRQGYLKILSYTALTSQNLLSFSEMPPILE